MTGAFEHTWCIRHTCKQAEKMNPQKGCVENVSHNSCQNLFNHIISILSLCLSLCVFLCLGFCWEITESSVDSSQRCELVKAVLMRARSVSSVITYNICKAPMFCLDFILIFPISPVQMAHGITRPPTQ